MKNTNIFPLERNHYFYGKLLTVRDFELEQKYFNDKRRLINRVLHGAGVVCGLGVTKSDDMTLLVESGLALDYLGREIALAHPDIKSLPMLPGYDTIEGKEEAFLCLRYEEQLKESVNAVGAESGQTQQFNKCGEGYSLYLSAEEPDIPAILDCGREQNSVLLISEGGVRIALCAPLAVASGEEFPLTLLIIKQAAALPISLEIAFSSDFFITSEEQGRLRFVFEERPGQTESVYTLPWRMRSSGVSDLLEKLATSAADIQLQVGDAIYSATRELPQEIFIARDGVRAAEYLERQDTLGACWKEDLPIYLAKLDLIPVNAAMLVRGVSPLPFGQRLSRQKGQLGEAGSVLQVESDVEVLPYWHEPEVETQYNQRTGTLRMHFGIPSAEANDYATTSGVVDVPFSNGMRINNRYYSEEISHNLGAGNVNLTLAVEFPEGDTTALLFGNAEVFRSRSENRGVPQVELGAVLYPERGTFRVGVWLMDSVEGSSIRIRYFASKVTNDVEEMKRKNRIHIKVLPEIQRMKVRERLHMKAVVTGCDDKSVIWSVRDQNGGSIDQSGIYQAPDTAGTYEISARSTADESRQVSAFVIVDE